MDTPQSKHNNIIVRKSLENITNFSFKGESTTPQCFLSMEQNLRTLLFLKFELVKETYKNSKVTKRMGYHLNNIHNYNTRRKDQEGKCFQKLNSTTQYNLASAIN